MMADRSAARDGRPMVVFYFSDCDPSGWQMPVSLYRKLQALKADRVRQIWSFRSTGSVSHQTRCASMACHQHR